MSGVGYYVSYQGFITMLEGIIPEYAERSDNAGTMLAHGLQHWTNIVPALAELLFLLG